MTNKSYLLNIKFFLIFFSFQIFAFAQLDSIQKIDTIQIFGTYSKKFHNAYQLKIIKDSLYTQSTSLTEVLQDQANFYFKEYGNGMVSSISLRGSGASHTAVLFNGITINSALNGQTDFNTIDVSDFSEIQIKKGGSSNLLGSGAIGGAINLKDNIRYNKTKGILLNIGFGSYSQKKINIQFDQGKSRFYHKYAISMVQSNNDYPYINTNFYNENGAFLNHNFKTVLGYKINKNNQFQLFANYSKNDRELSRTLSAPSNSKLINQDARFILKYLYQSSKINQVIDIVYLHEKYQFYLNKNQSVFGYGNANSYLFNYKIDYFINNKMRFYTGLDNKYTKANGSDILKKDNTILESFFLVNLIPTKNIVCNVSIRKGFSSKFDLPFIYSADILYTWNKNLVSKVNISTNYRIPTFNDLYWNPGGNPTLKPENNSSFEFGLDYTKNNITISNAAYLTKSKDLIQWQPVSSNFWQPKNIQNVTMYGDEIEISYSKKNLEFNLQYSYTVSKDSKTKNQLIYVPFHMALLQTKFKKNTWDFTYFIHYNGQVYTTTSNTQKLPDYFLSTIIINRKINIFNSNIGLKIKNIFNKNYQVIPYRPMPGRNFEFYFEIKF